MVSFTRLTTVPICWVGSAECSVISENNFFFFLNTRNYTKNKISKIKRQSWSKNTTYLPSWRGGGRAGKYCSSGERRSYTERVTCQTRRAPATTRRHREAKRTRAPPSLTVNKSRPPSPPDGLVSPPPRRKTRRPLHHSWYFFCRENSETYLPRLRYASALPGLNYDIFKPHALTEKMYSFPYFFYKHFRLILSLTTNNMFT